MGRLNVRSNRIFKGVRDAAVTVTVCLLVGGVPLAAGQMSAPAQAQGLATVQGTIRDSNHHPVAGATVSLRAEHGTETRTAQTDAKGAYRFFAVVEGSYTLRAEMAGYKEGAFGS